MFMIGAEEAGGTFRSTKFHLFYFFCLLIYSSNNILVTIENVKYDNIYKFQQIFLKRIQCSVFISLFHLMFTN